MPARGSRPTSPSAAIASSAAARPMLPAMRSWAGAESPEQPRLAHGGTPPGATTTAGTRVTPNRRNRRGSMATPASCPPRRSPTAFTVARNPPLADAAQHQRRPGPGRVARPLPPARRRHREAREQENLRRAATPRETVRRCAPRGVRPGAGPGTPCRTRRRRRPRMPPCRPVPGHARSPRASTPRARHRPPRAAPRPRGPAPPRRPRAEAPPPGRAGTTRPAAARTRARRGCVPCAPCRAVFRGGNMSVFSTAGSRSSRPRPGPRAAIPTAPRTARSGCSR